MLSLINVINTQDTTTGDEMATTLGRIDDFDSDKEDWTSYLERLEQYFLANDLEGEEVEKKRTAVFLTLIGRKTYHLLRSLIAPDKPASKSYKLYISQTLSPSSWHPSPSQSQSDSNCVSASSDQVSPYSRVCGGFETNG